MHNIHTGGTNVGMYTEYLKVEGLLHRRKLEAWSITYVPSYVGMYVPSLRIP